MPSQGLPVHQRFPVALSVVVGAFCSAPSSMVAAGHMAVECLKLASVTQDLDFNWNFFHLSQTGPLAAMSESPSHIYVLPLAHRGERFSFLPSFLLLKKFFTLFLWIFFGFSVSLTSLPLFSPIRVISISQIL